MVQLNNRLPIVLAALNLCGVATVTTAQNTSVPFDYIVSTDGNFTALNAALTSANISLTGLYADPITVFAPTDAALSDNSSAGILATYTGEQYIAHLTHLLGMHILPEELYSGDLSDGQSLTAVNGEAITVSVDGSTVTLSTVGSNATVTQPDVISSDGALHHIDGILLPLFATTSLSALTTTVDGFAIVTELLMITGLQDDSRKATVFAPTDEAFNALPEGALDYYRTNAGITAILLAGHVLSPKILPTQNMVDGAVYTSVGGSTLTIGVTEIDGETLYKVNNATISMSNVLASNGIIHALSKVIAVPGAEYPPTNGTVTPPTAPTTPTATPPTAPTSSAMSSTCILATMSAFFGWFLMA